MSFSALVLFENGWLKSSPTLSHLLISHNSTAELPVLELYQFEGCPFCQRARAALDALQLDYIVRTVPRGNRERVIAISRQPLVPVLVDPERGEVVPDSSAIIAYLKEHYGGK